MLLKIDRCPFCQSLLVFDTGESHYCDKCWYHGASLFGIHPRFGILVFIQAIDQDVYRVDISYNKHSTTLIKFEYKNIGAPILTINTIVKHDINLLKEQAPQIINKLLMLQTLS